GPGAPPGGRPSERRTGRAAAACRGGCRRLPGGVAAGRLELPREPVVPGYRPRLRDGALRSRTDALGRRAAGGPGRALRAVAGAARMPRARQRRAAGFTLLELLVALAILAILGAALLGHVRSARAAAQAGETASTDELALRLAAELLREELRLAGARPWPE